jgi:DNA-binding NarL/FixJ family response regulator
VIRVLLVDDQQLVRAGLRMLLAAEDGIDVVGEAGDGRAAITMAAQLVPDVVVMDLRMPGVDGISATSRIMAERPATRVVVLTTFGDDDHLYPALQAGACGFLLKDAPPGDLVNGIIQAAAGESPFSQEVLRRLVRQAVDARPVAPPGLDGLTAREREVLDLVAEGLTNAEIAASLHIGVTTVKTHVAALMAKTGSPNRVRLALVARRS